MFKNILTLADLKNYAETLGAQACGFKTNWFSTPDYAYFRLNAKIIEYPESPPDGIFNRILINDPINSAYFSVTLEPQRKLPPKIFQQREKMKASWRIANPSSEGTDFITDTRLNYDSLFFSSQDPVDFLVQWLPTVFSENALANFLNGGDLRSLLMAYRDNSSGAEIENWGKTEETIRIVEIRNDVRVIVLINPFDLHPEISFTALQETGIFTPLMSLIYSWFEYAKLRRLARRFDFSFDEEDRFSSYPEVVNNEQRLSINTSPLSSEDLDITRYVLKGARRQVSLYKEYFRQVLDIYPFDYRGRGDVEKNEWISVAFSEKKLRYLDFSRVLLKPEFDMLISYRPSLEKDSYGKEYLDFHFKLQYRPYIGARKEKLKWTWHHVEEDLGK